MTRLIHMVTSGLSAGIPPAPDGMLARPRGYSMWSLPAGASGAPDAWGPSPCSSYRWLGWCLASLTMLIVVACGWWIYRSSQSGLIQSTDTDQPAAVSTPIPPPAKPDDAKHLFRHWPQDRTPETVLVLSGQTYGYLSPCGCSRPQKGGLERRYNLIQSLKERGWPVVGLDLGDLSPPKGIHAQNLLKYKTAMLALREMGYQSVGLGEYDFASQIFDLLSAYTLNQPGKQPFLLSANLLGVQRDPAGKVTRAFSREEFFPGLDEKSRPMIDELHLVERPNLPPLGVVAAIGPSVAQKIVSLDKQFDFARNEQGQLNLRPALTAALMKLQNHPAKPAYKILLFAGKLEEAREVSRMFPEFSLILCQSDDSEPPLQPTEEHAGRTWIVQVGHKGQNVGVLGLYRTPTGQLEPHYQLVTLTEDYLTPEGDAAAKANPVLGLLEQYTQEVRDQNLLTLYQAKKKDHVNQLENPAAKLNYVGSEVCARCHAAEYAVWSKSKHSHAYEALEKYATRPSLRQFDGECLTCHTVGFDYKTGFSDVKTTPQLKNNGCENCHGPGSGHATNPYDKNLLAGLSKAWKSKPTEKLPPPEVMQAIAKMPLLERSKAKLTTDQRAAIDGVYSLCTKCHDSENDPKFDLYEYMPKIYHSNLKNGGLPPGLK